MREDFFTCSLHIPVCLCLSLCLPEWRDPHYMLITANSHVKECVAGIQGLLTGSHSRAECIMELTLMAGWHSWIDALDSSTRYFTKSPDPEKRLKHLGFVRPDNVSQEYVKEQWQVLCFCSSCDKSGTVCWWQVHLQPFPELVSITYTVCMACPVYKQGIIDPNQQ